MPRLPVGVDLTPVWDVIRQSVAPHTWVDYSTAWRRWVSFTGSAGFAWDAPSESAILAFLVTLMDRQFSYSYIAKTLAGVSFFFRLRRLPPCSSFFSVKQALKGYRKRHFAPDGRRPISVELLRRICEAMSVICFTGYEALLFQTAFVLAYFGAFRVSELLPGSKRCSRGMLAEHVLVEQGRVYLFLRQSKRDQLGRGEWVTLVAGEDSSLCPVVVVSCFVAVRPGGWSFFIAFRSVPGHQVSVFLCTKAMCGTFRARQFEVFLSFL